MTITLSSATLNADADAFAFARLGGTLADLPGGRWGHDPVRVEPDPAARDRRAGDGGTVPPRSSLRPGGPDRLQGEPRAGNAARPDPDHPRDPRSVPAHRRAGVGWGRRPVLLATASRASDLQTHMGRRRPRSDDVPLAGAPRPELKSGQAHARISVAIGTLVWFGGLIILVRLAVGL